MKRLLSREVLSLLLMFCLALHGSSHAADLRLTPAEQAWLDNHQIIRMSGPQAFPPFQYVGKDNIFKGIASDYVMHIAEMVGLRVEVIQGISWAEILQGVKAGRIDLLSCAAYTPERAAYLSYSNPHLSFPMVIISARDARFISGIEGLDHQRVVFVRKNVTYDWIQQEGLEVNPHFVDTPLEALREVSNGKADYAIENLAAASYLIEKYGLTNLKIAAPTPFQNYNLSIAVRKDWPELTSIINKGLAAITREKHSEIRQKWISVRYDHGIRFLDILQWIIGVGGIAACLLLLFYFWNRKLACEVEERKRAEAEKEQVITDLKIALDEIKTLRGILPICSECKKIRDDTGYWTRIESYIAKHSDADFSHSLCPDCVVELYGKEEWLKKLSNNE